jgi:hypothetical protein
MATLTVGLQVSASLGSSCIDSSRLKDFHPKHGTEWDQDAYSDVSDHLNLMKDAYSGTVGQ